MKPKFNLGDIVEVAFNGEVEGEKVTVRKRLFVQGVCVQMDGNNRPLGAFFDYRVCENDPFKHEQIGREYIRSESHLIELEPVVQELERTNRKVVPQPTPSMNDYINRAMSQVAAGNIISPYSSDRVDAMAGAMWLHLNQLNDSAKSAGTLRTPSAAQGALLSKAPYPDSTESQ